MTNSPLIAIEETLAHEMNKHASARLHALIALFIALALAAARIA
ncbi:MAG TPA: hypothetical protein VGM39_14145 [Kofleriaceae bacterium]|jgi:hypothetical protein